MIDNHLDVLSFLKLIFFSKQKGFYEFFTRLGLFSVKKNKTIKTGAFLFCIIQKGYFKI